MRFNDDNLANWLVDRSDKVKETLKKNNFRQRYTHAKIMDRSYKQFDLMQAVDPYVIHQNFDLNGMDGGAGPVNVESDDPMALNVRSVTQKNIMLRTINMRPVVNTENHLLRDRSSTDVLPGHVRAGLWMEIITGQHGSVAWSWEREDKLENNIFKGLFKYRPLQTEEYMRTAFDAQRLMPYVVAIAEEKPVIGVLYSRTSMLRNTDSMPTFFNCINALNNMEIPYAIIPEQMLENDELSTKLPTVKAILLPGTTHITESALDGLDYYLKMGFHNNTAAAILIGTDIAKYNEYAHPINMNIFSDTSVTALNIPDADCNKLTDAIRTGLKSIGISEDYQLIDTKTNKPVYGVYYKTAKCYNKVIATAVNAIRTPITCKWVSKTGKTKTFTDQTPLGEVKESAEFTLKPLQICCGTLK